MTLRVVGAGLGRTGTHSLKLALEQLLDGPCYHMIEVFGHPEHVPLWHSAFDGQDPDWDALFTGYDAAVDWPAGGCWHQLADHYPDSVILLSYRDTESWWRSFEATILSAMLVGDGPPGLPGWVDMAVAMFESAFGPNWTDKDTVIAGYERHNADVRATAPADRLLDWKTGDGWEPICAALGVAVPSEPFPHVNSTDDFRKMSGLDAT
jgi:hypothetical protein